jgi:putative hydrolase of the HAD superfamily
MNTTKIKHIIFDLGNVLVDIHPEKTMQKFALKCTIEFNNLKSFFLSPVHLDFMAGKYTPEEFYQKMMQQFSFQLSLTEFISIWNEVIGRSKKGIPELINRLKTRYCLSVCSNTDFWHWHSAIKKAPLLKNFENYFLSFQMKMNKPQPEIFEILLKNLKTEGKACLFFDDTKENIIQANNFGINGFCVSTAREIENLLIQMNNK